MNEIIKSLQSRRSFRNYNAQEITDEECKILIETAVQAPTARGLCPWEFILLRERAVLDKLSVAHPYGGMLKQAQAAILVCCSSSIQTEMGYLLMDGAAATVNILHAAHALGIGSCWLGLYPKEDRSEAMKKILGIPENIVPISLISLGRTDDEKAIPQRYDEKKIHLNNW